MFFVLSKDKIISYIVSFGTVMILLGIAFAVRNKNELIEVASTSKSIPIYSVQTDENKVALTINCAWNDDDIDKILEVLSQNNVRVTFFVVGDWVDKYPEAVKKINQAGHEIGNHSNTHPHVNKLSYEQNLNEINECNNKLEKLIGKKANLYRGPYGEYNDTVFKSAVDAKSTMIQWDIDSLDYNNLTKEEMWKRMDNNLKNGSIILMHNGTKNTANSLDFLIKNIKNKGYELVRVSDLIYQSDYYINSQGTQIKNK